MNNFLTKTLVYAMIGLQCLFFVTLAHAGSVSVGNIIVDTEDLIFESSGFSIKDTRRVVSGGNVGNLIASEKKDAILNAANSGASLTYNPKNPKDLWIVTCAHCVLQPNKLKFRRFFKVYFPETGEVVEFGAEDVVFIGDITRNNKDDIAIFNVRDDLLLKPLPMDPNFIGEAHVLAITLAFHRLLGTSIRVPTETDPCSFWKEPDRERGASQVATNCPGSPGSSGSPLIGRKKDGSKVIVGVFVVLETTEIDGYGDSTGLHEQKRSLFRLASIG